MDKQYINSLKALEKRNIKQHSMIEKSKIYDLYNIRKKLKYNIVNWKKDRKYQRTIERKVDFNQNEIEWEKSLTTDLKNQRIAVYTCIIDGYDRPINPSFIHENIDYFLYTNIDVELEHWNVRKIPTQLAKLEDAVLINRYIKLHPFQFFPEYDYILYIDGNIEVSSDVSGLINQLGQYGIGMHKHFQRTSVYSEAESLIILKKGNKERIINQINKYRIAGFPDNYGLAEATIILSTPNSEVACNIFELWWNEFLKSSSMRDQLSFPYIMWKNNYDINDVTTLGENLRLSGKFFMHPHKHKKN